MELYRPTFKPQASDAHDLFAAKIFTVVWGAVAVLFAAFASQLDNLIQTVNIPGSIFYGPMLGIFLPRVRATPARPGPHRLVLHEGGGTGPCRQQPPFGHHGFDEMDRCPGGVMSLGVMPPQVRVVETSPVGP